MIQPSLLVLAFSTLSALAQQHTLGWHTLGGGGGTSTGSLYSVRATVGQPEAGRLAGETYAIAGGFWSIVAAIQAEDAPLLRIEQRGAQVILAWPNAADSLQLQETPSLAAPTWANVNETPNVVGFEKQVTLPSQPGNRFFRLRAR